MSLADAGRFSEAMDRLTLERKMTIAAQPAAREAAPEGRPRLSILEAALGAAAGAAARSRRGPFEVRGARAFARRWGYEFEIRLAGPTGELRVGAPVANAAPPESARELGQRAAGRMFEEAFHRELGRRETSDMGELAK